MSLVRRYVGHGVFTELQFSMWKSERICVVYCSWSIMSSLLCLHLRIRQPSNHSVSPPSVIANFCLICAVARLDSVWEFEASSKSSTLVAEMERAEGDFRT